MIEGGFIYVQQRRGGEAVATPDQNEQWAGRGKAHLRWGKNMQL